MSSKKKPDRDQARVLRAKLGGDQILTSQQLQFASIIESAELGAYLETAFMVAGISKQRAYKWFELGNEGIDPYADFVLKLKQAQGRAILKNLETIDLAAARGDWKAAAWRLERMYPQLYGQRLELTERKDFDPGDAPVESTIMDLTKLSLGDLKELKRIMALASGTPPRILDIG